MAAMVPPLVNPGPVVTIRKFTSRNFKMQDLIDRQMLTAVQAEQLSAAVRRADNILIAGGTGAGKTSLLNVLADFIPEEERILIIEDTAELHIRRAHVVSTEAQLYTHNSAITFDDLLRSVLRHRPDRILVGEVRGKEARTLLDAMNTGHRGTLATIHASSAEEALRRLGTLALRGDASGPITGVLDEVCRCLDLVVHIARVDGRRFVREIYTVDKTLSVSMRPDTV
jgi:pilus assembly protein CpaF